MTQVDKWKNALDKGQQVKMRIKGAELAPHFSAGDTVVIQQVPMAEVYAGDIILCQVGSDIRLRQVQQPRALYGLPCLEVQLGKGSVVSRFVQQSAYLGKVINRVPGAAGPGGQPWWRSIFGARRQMIAD